MAVTAVRNRRLKISPGGIITLPVAARKALALTKGHGARVGVSVNDGAVVIDRQEGEATRRISPGGVMDLDGEARAVLSAGPTRHYYIKLSDEAKQVRLIPFG